MIRDIPPPPFHGFCLLFFPFCLRAKTPQSSSTQTNVLVAIFLKIQVWELFGKYQNET